MYQTVFQHLTSKEIKPQGWLKRQLRIQAEGLSGHLDKVWPDVRDSAWIGGTREGWERVPYWLDGFIPLAYLLDDEDLKSRAQAYIDAILRAQCEDGWICPCTMEERGEYDVWAVFLICKVLMVYGECTGDARAEDAVYRALRQLHGHIKEHPLFRWGQSRWFEALLPLHWLQCKKAENWMDELAKMLHDQGTDFDALFAAWEDQEPKREWTFRTHIVNLMMALKAGAVYSGTSGDDPNALALSMLYQLRECHGSAIGHVLGDECLAGKSPIRGAELCSIAEAMYSYEVLSEITGNPLWLDELEVMAFNSLPATISEDMWSHQYDQMENQIACAELAAPSVFGTNNTQANRFGLEPNFGCCTANLNQAWPKFALSTFMRTEKGVLSAALAPSSVSFDVQGRQVTVTLETDYPFEETLRYTVACDEPAAFELALRIPGFAAAAQVDGESVPCGRVHTISRVWQDGEQVEVKLAFKAEWVKRPQDMVCLRRGPLFYALPIKMDARRVEYEKDGVERKYPYCDYEILPLSPWNYAFAGEVEQVIPCGVGKAPFSREEPPIQLRVPMARIEWDTLAGQTLVCAEAPRDRAPLSEESCLLQPYGCTTLRMTVMPKIR